MALDCGRKLRCPEEMHKARQASMQTLHREDPVRLGL